MDTRWSLILTIQFSLLLFGLASSSPTFCHENERSALLKFKKSFFKKTLDSCFPYYSNVAYKKIESWKMDEEFGNCCFWDGIECDADNGHVIAVDLSETCLSGTIGSNTTLFHLVHLQKLNLSLNFQLQGHVPLEVLKLHNLLSLDLSMTGLLELTKPDLADLIQNLTKLETLNLSEMFISAPIPNILANLSSLRSLNLAFCFLRGEFPPNIFKMPKLEFLDVTGNDQLSGHLPEFYWRSPLNSLSILYTNFSGEVPSSLGNLASLNELELGFNNFNGQIPSSISNLTQLTRLYICGKLLRSEIPFWIRNFTRLTELSLYDNQLTGVIPSWIGQLSNLETLDLRSNKLAGIPSSLVNLTHLTYLDLSLNQLSGLIPSSITKLKNLAFLNLYSNNLNGIVSLSMFTNLRRLVKLQLSFNKFSFVDELNNTNANLTSLSVLGLASCNLSSFPSFLQHSHGLRLVDLSCNNIYGEIPKWFLNMNTESLEMLNLSRNSFTSSPHQPINFRWKALRAMDLRDNNLKGSLPIPPAFIEIYLVSRNNFSGELPPHICKLSKIMGLDLGENNFTGILPHCLNNLSNTLSFLSLRGNNLCGDLRSLHLDEECNLRMLDLSSNRFQGSIPRSLANCYLLEFLNLGSNQMKDVFPSWLGSLSNLRVLLLRDNEFHGPIGEPKFSDDFASLQIIDLSSNKFSSCLPSKYFGSWKAMKSPSLRQRNYLGEDYLPYNYPLIGAFGMYEYSFIITMKGIKMPYGRIQSYLNFIDLSSNNFTCEIPNTIARLVEVQFLNFSNNMLTGIVPSFLKALTELQTLDLSQNKLHGKIPQELTQLTFLEKFNVSYNNLSGRVPQGRQFDTFDNDSYFGNAGLCGLPLSKKCYDFQVLTEAQPQPKTEGEESIVIDWKVVLVGYGSGLVIGVIIGQKFTIKPPRWMLECFGIR